MDGAEYLNSKLIIGFWGVVTLLLTVLIVRRGRQSLPTRLRLGSGGVGGQLRQQETGREVAHQEPPKERRASARFGQGARQLNLIFEHQGQKHDAYQVLALPAGSSMEHVLRAYDHCLERAQTIEEKELVRAAYKALAG